MGSEKLDSRNNFHNFVKQQKELMDTFAFGKNTCTSVLKLDGLFQFFEEHFNEFRQEDNFRVVLTFVHRCLKIWICRDDYLKDDIGILLVNFIVNHNGNENDMHIVFQIVYQVLNSIKFFGCKDVVITEKLLRELIETLLLIESRKLASNCLACMQLYMEMFPERRNNLKTLWSNLTNNIHLNMQNGLTKETEIDILIQLFDHYKSVHNNICDEPILITIIQNLLKSDQRHFRKCGYYLLKKLCQCFIEKANCLSKIWISACYSQQIEFSWTLFITTLENLEEEQSHLILPSLENLKELVKGHHLPNNWLNILYMKLLTHNNMLVLRWSIEFFLKTFSCGDLSKNILKHLLRASNCNSLFNLEGYFLEDVYFSSFLKDDVTILLPLFSEVENWKSLPLFKWLENLNKLKKQAISLTFSEILSFCGCVRKMQNKDIRKKAITQFNLIFKDKIEKMSIKEYVMYIEALYNCGDEYRDHYALYSKKLSINESKDKSIFTQRFSEIVKNSLIYDYLIRDLFLFLKDVPIEKQGFLKYAIFNFWCPKSEWEDVSYLYKLDLNSLACCNKIQIVINEFENCFLDSPPYNKNELVVCKRAAIAFYIYENPCLKDENEETINLILNSEINKQALQKFVEKLLTNSQKKISLCFIEEFLKHKDFYISKLVYDYLCEVYEDDVVRGFAKTMIKQITQWKCYPGFIKRLNFLKEATDELFERLPSQGDKRIEEAFIFNRSMVNPMTNIYLFAMEQIRNFNSLSFAKDLMSYHSSITKIKPRYFENSYEHRVKLRIAICVYYFFKYSDDKTIHTQMLDDIWNILLNENNQLNVTYIYEFIIGSFDFRDDEIIKKLNEAKKFTSSQQVSAITVTYTYFATHSTSNETKEIVVRDLLSLSMGANFQTRLFAQLSLYKLLKSKFHGLAGCEQILDSIDDATGNKTEDFLHDIRLNFQCLSDEFIVAVLRITNAPFDELVKPYETFMFQKLGKQIECCRLRYMKKLRGVNKEASIATNEVNDQVQRKMNPVNDISEPHNLFVFPTEENSCVMYVVASLIDKIPNLGGIARTCEVLGIQNLVMDSKMHTEKEDFKNLSMTAEKNLNIHEVKPKDLMDFLVSKRLEGFSIVGAEQTCKSKTFNNFQFPKKCVLLLGHEKNGIPAPLLGLLDHAVEIPQFGQVRSLNVHVTGALFMWEFCKQHLLQK